MLPGPLLVSPPDTLHLTDVVAVNCSAAVPLAEVALQPVQLVSSEAVPGEMLKAPVEGLADTPPELQPASTSAKGATSAKMRAATAPYGFLLAVHPLLVMHPVLVVHPEERFTRCLSMSPGG